MLAQNFLLLTLVSFALAGVQLSAVPATEPLDLHPQYAYSYSIQDSLTGDAKTHTESRDGKNVQGEYSIVEPDGTLRTVTYTADVNGFNAIVNRRVGYASPVPVYAPHYHSQQAVITPAASFAYPTVAKQPIAIRKRVVYKARPAQIAYPAFQNQVVLPAQKIISHRPVNFVQQQPQVVLPVQQQPQVVIQEQPQPVQVQPAPVPVQPLPQPVPVEQPQPHPVQEIPSFPQPQPPPAPIQPQPARPVIPQPQPAPAFQQPQNDDFDTVEVEAAPRSSGGVAQARSLSAGPLDGSSRFAYSSRGNQYDFNVAY